MVISVTTRAARTLIIRIWFSKSGVSIVAEDPSLPYVLKKNTQPHTIAKSVQKAVESTACFASQVL